MEQTRDDGTVYSVIDRAARLALALAVLGLAVSGVAAADNATTPAPATPAPAADDPGATEPVDANAGMAIPSATGPVAGAGIAAGIAIGVGLFSRFGREQ
ncbi:hypothetical protein ACOZ4N_12890 [Halorientalis pallida]|uniref:hypothetical protein n=1 Tax=Halorientalis pallida TaxID=2479928 RepID=UPI003C7014FB